MQARGTGALHADGLLLVSCSAARPRAVPGAPGAGGGAQRRASAAPLRQESRPFVVIST